MSVKHTSPSSGYRVFESTIPVFAWRADGNNEETSAKLYCNSADIVTVAGGQKVNCFDGSSPESLVFPLPLVLWVHTRFSISYLSLSH